MAFGKLVNDKIVIDTNNALNYKSESHSLIEASASQLKPSNLS
ncbi:hypothetical protein [Campylobacter coli]|nr:hypothetical protein [Campylobacter coli]